MIDNKLHHRFIPNNPINPIIPNIIFSKPSESISSEIFKLCKEKEQREIRSNKLYDVFNNNILYSNTHILINDLVSQYNIKLEEILIALYYKARSRLNFPDLLINPFQLPKFRIIRKITYQHTSENWFKQKYSHIDQLISEYLQTINTDNSDGIQRMLINENGYYYIILKKGNDYDYTQLQFLPSDPNVKYEREKSISHLTSESSPQDMFMVEIKDSCRSYDSTIITNILKMAQSYDSYIGKIGNTDINQLFDGSNEYNVEQFNQLYGNNGLESAILDIIIWRLRIEAIGDMSIQNNSTIDMIQKITKKVCNEDQIYQKIYNDFINHTKHSLNDTEIEIGKLMDLYNIHGYELFLMMYHMLSPCGFGWIEYLSKEEEAKSIGLDEAKKILLERQAKHNTTYFDYYNGKPLKNRFRLNQGESQYINIKTYDYDRKGLFYKCILELMLHKSQQKMIE
jgi:hypothetical protein